MKLDFVVIGAQKSASTFVQVTLQSHPDIYLPDGETPYFEDPDYKETPLSNFQAIFQGRREKVQGIKRPNYLGKPEVPERIYANFPDTKLIAVLRDPTDRAIAGYFHQIKYGVMEPFPVEEGLNKILDGDAEFLDRAPRAREVLKFGLYYENLSRYYTHWDADRILVLLHSDIVANPGREIKRIYQFLGVDDNFLPQDLNKRPQKVIYSIPRLKFLSRRNKFLHCYNEDRTRLTRRRLAPHEFVYVGAITAIDRFFLARVYSAAKPVVSDALRGRLHEYYRSDIVCLSSLLSRDLSSWLAP